jgi:hypothetical protein
MIDRPSDEEVARQILGVFLEHRMHAGGILRRNNFFKVRDGDFQRGMNKAFERGWLRRRADRYTYELTQAGWNARLEQPADDARQISRP